MSSEILKKNQTLPQDFAELLAQMKSQRNRNLGATLLVARLNGWTLQSLASALGVSRQAIEHRLAHAAIDVDSEVPDVPLPPRKQTRKHQPRRRLLVNDALAEQLREMALVAAKVNGASPADAPERRVSEEFSAMLHSLVEQGVTVYHLAQVLGVTHGAITLRLARHGYRNGFPSQNGTQYLGRATHEGPNGVPSETCKRGHELSGANLYVIPKTGARVCRECDARRRSAYYARKAKSNPGGVA